MCLRSLETFCKDSTSNRGNRVIMPLGFLLLRHLFALLIAAVPQHDYGISLLVTGMLMFATATKINFDGIHKLPPSSLPCF